MLTILAFLIGPAFAIVQLFISVYAQKKKRNTGSNLMVAGSLIALLHACTSSFLSYSLTSQSYDGVDHEYYASIMPYVSLLSVLAGILFLLGLALFVQSIAEDKGGDWTVIDRRD